MFFLCVLCFQRQPISQWWLGSAPCVSAVLLKYQIRVTSQQAHKDETMMFQCWFNVLTLNQCWIDIVSMLCVCWDYADTKLCPFLVVLSYKQLALFSIFFGMTDKGHNLPHNGDSFQTNKKYSVSILWKREKNHLIFNWQLSDLLNLFVCALRFVMNRRFGN